MHRKLVLSSVFIFFLALTAPGQVRIRIFSSQNPGTAVFSVAEGRYELNTYNGPVLKIERNDIVIITRFKKQLAVKTGRGPGFSCDSLSLTGRSGQDRFSLRVNDGSRIRQQYAGDLQCFSDLGTLVLINNCDVESYIAGVVRAEGGSGKNKEYVKTQAILARTYMYKYSDRHAHDRYNVCDNTHCQAFNGITTDSLITRAAFETRGLVILDHDSSLVISAFHSNCGGETSLPEDVWLTRMPYLKRINDPYCISSHNASWSKTISLNDWLTLLRKLGYRGETDNPAAFTFSQKSRQTYYRTGTFAIPLSTIREELNLRSAFFSVISQGDSIILKGRGYGHGVGLCQEGAMTMAEEGHNYREIIRFYYSDVIITDVSRALFQTGDTAPRIARGGF